MSTTTTENGITLTHIQKPAFNMVYENTLLSGKSNPESDEDKLPTTYSNLVQAQTNPGEQSRVKSTVGIFYFRIHMYFRLLFLLLCSFILVRVIKMYKILYFSISSLYLVICCSTLSDAIYLVRYGWGQCCLVRTAT